MTYQEPTEEPQEARLPQGLLVGTLALCILPFLLTLLGVDLGSPPLEGRADADALHRALAGSFVHTLLEWSAFLAALFTVILAFTHYRLEHDPATPIIGMALFSAGTLDVFHILAADRLLDAVADNRQLIPFTWVISRLFNALVLIAGPLALLLQGPHSTVEERLPRRRPPFVLLTCGAFALLAYVLVYASANSTRLPQTLFPDALVSRPWDLIPLVLFAVAGVLLHRFHRRNPSIFTASLYLSCVPQIATQVTMVFGSDTLFDSGFNIAHGLKVAAYAIPFAGLVLDYVHTYRLAQRSNEELESRVQTRTEELRRAEAEAQAANRAKSDFLAHMSHELRTPLNSILGYAQIFRRDDSLEPRLEQGLGVIEQSGEHLLELINDILDLAKIEAGKLELATRAFRLPSLLENLVESEGPRARQRGLHLVFEPATSLPETVYGDDRRVRQILLNLLSNAIKFTETGGVTLRAGRPGDSEDRLRFEIHDTGTGIAKERLEEIFRPFEQAGETPRRTEGTGLGLAITCKLLRLMGGSIEVESTPGKGSLFTVTLPLPSAEATTVTEGEDDRPIVGYRGARRSILVVDDKATNRAILRGLLAPLGFEVDEAADGEEALHQAQELRPDLILMDLVMPVLDGFEATRRLRQAPQFAQMPIIALSASVFERNQEASLDAGCDDFLPKPVRLDDLLSALGHQLELVWIRARPPRPPAADEAPQHGGSAEALPTAESRQLLDLARRGAVREIVTRLDQLAVDERFATPVTRLRRHAAEYDMQTLRDILSGWLDSEV